MYPERSVFMRAHLRAALVFAAVILPGCADTSFIGEVGPGSVTGPGASLTLQLSRDSVSVDTGKVVVLSASLSNGADPSTLGAVSWQTSDARVATVSNQGEVKGVGAGSATVSASAGNVSARAKVTVTASANPSNPVPPDTSSV